MISCPEITTPIGECFSPPLKYKTIPIEDDTYHVCKLTISDDETQAIYTHEILEYNRFRDERSSKIEI